MIKGRNVIGLSGLVVSLVCFVLGLTLPVLSSHTSLLGFTLRSESIYLTDTIQYFFQEGDWFMALLIGITTVLFPVLKYAVLFNGTLHLIPVRDSVQKVFSQLDKWSMIEVFILALIIMGIKSNSGFVSITMESGAYFLAVSVISRMITSFYVSDEHTYVRVK